MVLHHLLSMSHIWRVTDRSCCDSTGLLIIADASDAYPVIVKNITSPSDQHQSITFSEKEYKYKNRCAAYSPLSNSAMIITRSGTVKLANCSLGLKSWTVVEVGERMVVSGRCCSLGFSTDGSRVLALDRRGKLLVLEFSISFK